MREDLEVITIGFILGILISGIILIEPICSKVNYLRKDEYIKQLEQSLNEQIQEKQVYINMLERTRK